MRPTDAPAGEVLAGWLAAQVAEVLRRADDARRGEPDGVHQARVSARRLRTTLTAYRPLLDAARTEPVRAELRWYAGTLGPARDVEVVAPRLRSLLETAPAAVLAGPVLERLDRTRDTRSQQEAVVVAETLASARLERLGARLTSLRDAPPLAPSAARPAAEVLVPLLRREWRRLARRVDDTVGGSGPGTTDRVAHDLAVHEARKAAKRVRYALEPVEPLWGPEATALRERVKELTAILGDRQDTVVARVYLAEVAAAAATAEEPTPAYDWLAAAEAAEAARLDAAFAAAWQRAADPGLRRWLG